jgi:hypothetical protein
MMIFPATYRLIDLLTGSPLIFLLSVITLLLFIIVLQRLKIRKQRNSLSNHLVAGSKAINKKILDSRDATIDMENLMNSINKAESLFKQLSKKYHPDRFINSDNHTLAEQLFQQITENKRNYQQLVRLQKQAEEHLINK